MSSRHELIGIYNGLKRPSTCWENSDGTQTIIGVVEVANEDRDIKGSIFPGQLVRGLTYRFYGFTKTHDKYGDQFCFESFVIETPSGQDAIVAYLTQCKGIGPATARKIYCAFNDDAVRMLREEPDKAALLVPLTPKIAAEASEYLKKSEKMY